MSMIYIWPAGQHKEITINPTAGNVITNIQPGTGKQFLVLNGRIEAITDVTVTNRWLAISKVNSSAVLKARWPTSPAIPASSTGVLYLLPSAEQLAGLVASPLTAYLGVKGLLIVSPDYLTISLSSGGAGDSYSGKLDILEVDIRHG